MDDIPRKLFHAIDEDLNRYFADHVYLVHGSKQTPLMPGLSAQRIAATALANSILKKYEPTVPDKSRDERAIALFLKMNRHCGEFDLQPSQLINQMKLMAFREFGETPSWPQLLQDGGDVGPGASVGSSKRNSRFEKYFCNHMTTTSSSLYYLWYRNRALTPARWTAEIKRIELSGGEPYCVVNGSTLSTVPKNSEINRTVCKEPSLNMIFQKALGKHINKVLRRAYGYDEALQPDRNRRMACEGSLEGTRATIDLSSASDTISLNLCKEILPPPVMGAILDCRSPYVQIGSSHHELNMVSSMGNGFTFPLETYIFSLIVRATAKLRGIHLPNFQSEEWGVFGDDIIVPTVLYEPVIAALESLGFYPNTERALVPVHLGNPVGLTGMKEATFAGSIVNDSGRSKMHVL